MNYRMRTQLALGLAILAISGLGACERYEAMAPPEIYFGEDVCDVCGMIIQDDYFASAIAVRSERGVDQLLFDDIGEMMAYTESNADQKGSAWFVRTLDEDAWRPASEVDFVRSRELMTPMATGLAAFTERAPAEALIESRGGEMLTFEAARSRSQAEGFDVSPGALPPEAPSASEGTPRP